MRRSSCVVAAVSAIALSLCMAAPATGAVAIGSSLTSATQDNIPCSNPCTSITFDAPPIAQAPGGLRSPIDGVVTSWRIKSGSGAAPVKLRILRPAIRLSFTGAGTSSSQLTVVGTSAFFPTQLPIKAGDAVGIDADSIEPSIYGDSPSATLALWVPPLLDGATVLGTSFAAHETQVQAVVEADVDCDGNGDETQDPNLTDGICKTKPVQTLKAKRKQRLAKAAVSETVDKAGTVILRARVRIPRQSKRSRALGVLAKAVKSKGSRRSLAAGVKTKIKIRFSRRKRKRIRAVIGEAGPRKVVVRAKATDSFGNVSTKRVRFRLVG